MAYNIALSLAKKYGKEELLEKYGTLEYKKKGEKYDRHFILENEKNFTGKSIKCCDDKFVYCNNQWVPKKVEALINKVSGEGIIITKI